MDQQGVERALGNFNDVDQSAARVKEQDLKRLDFAEPIIFPHERRDRLRCIENWRVLAQLLRHFTREGESSREGYRFVAADTLYGLQLLERGLSEGLQRAEFLNQLLADLNRIDASQACSQKNRQQFSLTERVSAMGGEPLARAFARGLILEPHSTHKLNCILTSNESTNNFD